jgi:hypothetical protein
MSSKAQARGKAFSGFPPKASQEKSTKEGRRSFPPDSRAGPAIGLGKPKGIANKEAKRPIQSRGPTKAFRDEGPIAFEDHGSGGLRLGRRPKRNAACKSSRVERTPSLRMAETLWARIVVTDRERSSAISGVFFPWAKSRTTSPFPGSEGQSRLRGGKEVFPVRHAAQGRKDLLSRKIL